MELEKLKAGLEQMEDPRRTNGGHILHKLEDITPELEHRKSGYVERKRRPYQGNVVRIA